MSRKGRTYTTNLIKRTWKFDVDGQHWTVTFNNTNKFWHISTERTFQRSFQDYGTGIPSLKKIEHFLSIVIEEYKRVNSKPYAFTVI